MPFQVLAQVPNCIPPRLPIDSSEWDAQNRTVPGHPTEDVQASTMTTPLPTLQTAPHESERSHKLAELKERARVHHENNCILWLRDLRHSWGYAEETGEESSTTTPVLALREAPRGSPKHCVPAAQLIALRKRMAGYREEERLRKLQEEQELLDAPANAECNAEMTSECSTWTAQDSTDAGAPPVVAAVAPPPRALDNG
jgi:hypothetical protein